MFRFATPGYLYLLLLLPLLAGLYVYAVRSRRRALERFADEAVLPGLMPKIIRKICVSTGKPVIAGGLISDKEDVTGALGAGAIAVSSTNPAVWNM